MTIFLNWIVLLTIFFLYLLNIWRSSVIKKIRLEIAELKKEKEELIQKQKKQKDFYQEIVKNYSALIEENK